MKYPHDLGRVKAFSDAVFAFAATLLVVSVGQEASDSILNINWSVFFSFGVSFFVLVGLWSVHYHLFRRTGHMDNWMIALNTILLFTVLYYVFPLKSLLSSMTGQERIQVVQLFSLFQLYSLGFLLIFGCYSLMYLRAYKKTRIQTPNQDLYFYSRHFAIYVLVSALSLLISELEVGMGFFLPGTVYILLGPLCYFHALWFDKKIRSNS